MVAWTRLDIKLHVHFLSCLFLLSLQTFFTAPSTSSAFPLTFLKVILSSNVCTKNMLFVEIVYCSYRLANYPWWSTWQSACVRCATNGPGMPSWVAVLPSSFWLSAWQCDGFMNICFCSWLLCFLSWWIWLERYIHLYTFQTHDSQKMGKQHCCVKVDSFPHTHTQIFFESWADCQFQEWGRRACHCRC